MNTLKFKAKVAYTLPCNFIININNSNKVEINQLGLELNVDSNFRLKITKVSFETDEEQQRLFITFENEGILSESLDTIQKKINDIKERLQEIFKEIGENLTLLLLLSNYRLPLISKKVRISPTQIGTDKYDIIDPIIDILFLGEEQSDSVCIVEDVQLEPNDLNDVVKKAVALLKLDEDSKKLLNLLKRIVKWYYLALDESDETDKFIDYLMILEIWKLYKAYKDNDEKCIPIPKPRSSHKECLSKAIKDLCNKHVFSNWVEEFNNFYDGRNKVIHEGLLEETSKHLEVASKCAEKIIEELRKEIQILSQYK